MFSIVSRTHCIHFYENFSIFASKCSFPQLRNRLEGYSSSLTCSPRTNIAVELGHRSLAGRPPTKTSGDSEDSLATAEERLRYLQIAQAALTVFGIGQKSPGKHAAKAAQKRSRYDSQCFFMFEAYKMFSLLEIL